MPGAPASEWDVPGGGDPSIVGFATEISVNQGETVFFKVSTPATNYRFDIYRLGYYDGDGARKVATVQPSVALPQNQPSCLSEPATGLVDCGNWAVSGSWAVPASAVSGIYLATLVREDPEDDRRNHIIFVVRDDDGGSDLLFQTSDTTWHAYNDYGGNSLYTGSPDGRAYKVSYNRPFNTRTGSVIGGIESFLFGAEYPMVRWLESNGYDVSYTTGVDTDRRGAELLEHEVFLSNGHDEYWSATQRANVEAARDAGVHLAFFSGNEMFWKTRWETSIDGSGTAYRTLVSYKETKAYAKIDPSPEWTGTWRDPSFSPPSDGGRPENAVTGQFFRVNGLENWVMRVPEADGKMRFWRNTSIATQSSGQVAELPFGVLGYEWDEVPDNGHQPPGLVRLSSTTHDVTPLFLLDQGNTYGEGIATHNLTLYRHSSGAIVFGAGTVQWAWGLDDYHDGLSVPTDQRMQQATVNLFADMGVQPASLRAPLTSATASTDVTAPTSLVTSPAAGFTGEAGTPITVTGTASDSSGRVGGVEVSTDNGATWHFASGRNSWTYTWTPEQLGPVTIRSRAVDDSGNLGAASPGVSGTVGFGSCPCSIWDGGGEPAILSQTDTQPVELGVKFQADVDGFINGVRFYKGPANTGTHTGNLWSSSGTLLATGQFTNETSSGWQTLVFATPIAVTANQTYVASYHTTSGGYSLTPGFFLGTGAVNPPMRALANNADGPNGVYRYGASGFPTNTYQGGNYWVDVVFDDTYSDTVAPAVSSRTPASGATGVSFVASVTATLSEPVTPASINFVLRRPDNSIVPSATSYDAGTRVASLQPSSPLASGTTYTATLSGAADPSGNVVTSTSWSFTTVDCPCSVWTDGTVATGNSQVDGVPVELGVKFRSDIDGFITGVRFYKGPGNVGTHVGNLWTTSGELLATATFTGETSGGWQKVTFPAPVAVTANTTYVASYHNPTGSYIVSQGFFSSGATSSWPLTAPSVGDSGGNGVYRFDASGFPQYSYQGSNYWVDVTFNPEFIDPVAPSLVASSPASGSTSNPATTAITATFSEPVAESSVSVVLTGPGNIAVPASVSYDANSRTATLQPAALLALDTTYTATVSGATDPAGNVVTNVSWSFTTVECPCGIWSDSMTAFGTGQVDGTSVELGVKFTSEIDGYITGVRFYKGSGNVGTHIGNLWTASGTLLATATFTNETGSGWQEVSFPTPVAVTANTTYVASYHNPTGSYTVAQGFFEGGAVTGWPIEAPSAGSAGGNGVYRYGESSFPLHTYQGGNYWVDVRFVDVYDDNTAPQIATRTPAQGAGDIPGSTAITATFTEAITPGSASFVLRRPDNSVVPATMSYEQGSLTATLQPSSGLTLGVTYTATVSGATDAAGNVMSTASWSFTTVTCPCSLWTDLTVATGNNQVDGQPLELGVKFTSSVDGFITGIRFYKAPGDQGTHLGSLWTIGGELLATAAFENETASGWQQVTFEQPVPVTANTTYVASYHTSGGHYIVAPGYFIQSGRTTWPLTAPSADASGGNGVYRYGASAFPSNSYQGGNYWVDVTFVAE